jgi:hypothetical protein
MSMTMGIVPVAALAACAAGVVGQYRSLAKREADHRSGHLGNVKTGHAIRST